MVFQYIPEEPNRKVATVTTIIFQTGKNKPSQCKAEVYTGFIQCLILIG